MEGFQRKVLFENKLFHILLCDKLSRVVAISNHYFTQFVRRDEGVIWLWSSNLSFCEVAIWHWPELQHLKVCLGLESLLPKHLTHVFSKFHQLVGSLSSISLNILFKSTMSNIDIACWEIHIHTLASSDLHFLIFTPLCSSFPHRITAGLSE